MKVVRTAYEPVLSRNEGHASNGDLGDLECLDQSTCFVVPDEDVACVKAGENPWLRRVEIYRLDARRPGQELALCQARSNTSNNISM